jgi:hypothetical protein
MSSFASIVAIMAGVIAMALTSATGAWAGEPLGPDAQLFGLIGGLTSLAHSSTFSFVNQSPTAPKVGSGFTIDIGGPTTYLSGDLVAAQSVGPTISLGNYVTVVGQCVTAGGSIVTATGATCGSSDTSGGNPLFLDTLGQAEGEAGAYSIYLAGLSPTTTLGDITLKKYQSLTVKLRAGLNVVAIGNITSAGGNTITLSAPEGAVVVVNLGGLTTGAGTMFATAGGLNPHNLIWNIEGEDPIFGAGVKISGTVLNFVEPVFSEPDKTVTFDGQSVINGALITTSDVTANGAMHLNFWPFTAAP